MKTMLSPKRLYGFVKTPSTAPRWTIFLLDLSLCACALIFAFLLRFNMELESVAQYDLRIPLLAVTGLNLVFFRLLRSYEGIIRLSGAEEAYRCVTAVSLTVIVVAMSIFVSSLSGLPHLIPFSVLMIYFFIASFIIFSYRMWIKFLYFKSLKYKISAEHVLIYGNTENGAFMKKAIESVPDRQYKVSGFVENDGSFYGKSIDNTRIYTWEDAKACVKKLKIKQLFLATSDIDLQTKNEIVDFCLAHDITVKTIPAANKWVDGQLQPRQLKNLNIEDLLNRPSIQLAAEPVQAFLRGKRILVTGAAGSIGSEITRQLATMDISALILCDNRETGLYELQNELSEIPGVRQQAISVYLSDVRNRNIMNRVFETFEPEIIFHAAAYKHVPMMEAHPCQAVRNNVLGTKIVADLAVQYGVERFILISTDKAVNPTNIMGASKRIAEMYVAGLQRSASANDYLMGENGAHRATKFITTRFGNVLGSNGSVIPRFRQQIDHGGPVTVTHPDIIRYFMTIPEACSLVLEAATMGHGGELFIFDMGEPVRIVDLATKMIRLSGYTPGKDMQISYTGLRPGEKLYEELLNNDEEVMPTHHKKIMISKVSDRGINKINYEVDHLISLAGKSDRMSVVKQMKKIVVEFKSENSIYKDLDNNSESVLEGVQIIKKTETKKEWYEPLPEEEN